MEIKADLVAVNGNIITMDPEQPTATALAVKSYKVLAVGSDEMAMDLVSTAKRVIDLGGKTVVPGFVDAHCHLTQKGIRSSYVHLHDAKSPQEVKKRLKREVPKHEKGQWIRGFGWDESNWDEKRYLTRNDLDEISKEHPIAIDRVDLHLASVNSMALEELDIDLDQDGVEKDKKGKPTGVLKDIEGLYDNIEPSEKNVYEGVVAGNRLANEVGITTAVDNAPAGYLRSLRRAERTNELTARMIINPPVTQIDHLTELGITSGMGGAMVRIGGAKIFTDGSIGARTAALSEPYADDKDNTGKMLLNKEDFSSIIRKAMENDIQTVTHAIGDRAIEMVISSFEESSYTSKIRNQRHRIEHAELISLDQIRRAASLGLILSMQPNFVGRWQQKEGLYMDRLGEERVMTMNMFKAALDNGARLCFGSDGMPLGPIYGIWSAVSHHNPKVQLNVEEALRCYTMEGAYSSFVENIVGSLKEGKRADFAVLSDNILEVPPNEICDIEVERTILGGKVEYSNPKAVG
ncbi:MAG: amidohydrolase family protein [Candidatus Lokiarchaeota archaeon]|nr:amidohydrolase family protein [Candidatus Lokiarchaeota archaeon]